MAAAPGGSFSWGGHFPDEYGGRPLPAWVRFAPAGEATRRAVFDLSARDAVHSVLVQGRRCQTMEGLLATWGDALEFPSYYGGNLDAFDECLTDLLDLSGGGLGSAFGDRAGRPARTVLVTVQESDRLLARENDAVGAFLSLLDHAAREGTAALRVLFVEPSRRLPEAVVSRS
ncbi:hypothetical protein GCM10027445_43930 [Amycolatopsis endophytica]|uniref:Barstar (barnase inhibitor) domain-containing protein n=1 Tax=Amycolatopsis endophytica TaxID=860233 RepID=A0A853BER2_9PSEU|nr:barstar family protein [Amycolatopsis endophytica]NYI93244.1 hypothetical protein [Amycolatopsis endophytica]